MSKGPLASSADVAGAFVDLVLARRQGESRRDALVRLRGSLQPGRDSLGGFAGTPCSAELRASHPTQGAEAATEPPSSPAGQS
jgi:hypothetical protein